MEEPHAEGLATHGGPESCRHVREVVPEALTGVRVGRVWSRESFLDVPGAQTVCLVEGRTSHCADEASSGGPGEVEDPEHARKHLAREPGDPVTALERMVLRGRGGKSEDAIRR